MTHEKKPGLTAAALSDQSEGFFRKPQLAVSATECTGLCQTPVADEAQREALTDLYPLTLAVQGQPETEPPYRRP